MSLSQNTTPQEEIPPGKNRATVFLIGLIVVCSFLLVLVFVKSADISNVYAPKWFSDFDTMQVQDGFHKVSIPNGNRWEISYEANHEVVFQGLVKYNYDIREEGFEILTQDILITSGDYSNPQLVSTRVADHHFIYRFLTDQTITGTINLLHTVPVNEEVHQQLMQVKPGDMVVIKGWEIYSVKGYDPEGKFIGTWQDAGCNTTLITQVVILPEQESH